MAEFDLGAAVVAIKVDLAKLEAGLKAAKGQTETTATFMGRAFDKLKSNVSGLGVALGGLATAGAVAGFASLVRGALNAAEAIADTAAKAAISAERLQELRFAFTQNAASVGQVDAALIKFNAVLGEFIATGAGAAQQGFALIGITSREAARDLGNAEEAFDEVVKRIATIEDPARRAGVAARIFGEEAGPTLAVLIGQGTVKIEELAQKARDLGIVLREDAVAQAAAASAELRALGEVVSQQVTAALIEAAPQVIALAEAFANSLPTIIEWAQAIGQAVGLLSVPAEVRFDEVRERLVEINAEMAKLGSGPAASTLADTLNNERIRLEDEYSALVRRIELLNEAKAKAAIKPGEGGGLPLPELPDVPGKAGAASKEKEADAYERLIETIRVRQRLATDELRVSNETGEAADRLRNQLEALRLARELEAAAIRDGKTITPELRAEIDATANAYRAVRDAITETSAAQKAQADSAENSKRAIEALANGISTAIQTAESFEDALKNVGIQLANLALQGLLGVGPAAGLFNDILGVAAGGIFAAAGGAYAGPTAGGAPVLTSPTGNLLGMGGRANGGPVRAGVPTLVNEFGLARRKEVFVPSEDGGVLNVEQAQAALRGGASGSERARIEVMLSPDLEARIIQQAAGQSVAISRQAVAGYNAQRGASKRGVF